MKKFILYTLPFIAILYSLDALFVDIYFHYEATPVFNNEEDLPLSEVSDYQIKIGNGLIQTIYKMSIALTELKDIELPQEGELEKTTERLERFLISKKISLVLHLFVIALALSSFFSVYHRAWFSLLTSRTLYVFILIISFIYLLRSILHMRFILVPGLLSFLVHFGVFCLSIYAIFVVGSYLEENISYANLYIASFNEEESNTGKVILPFEKKEFQKQKSSLVRKIVNFFLTPILLIFRNKIVIHFFIIIFIGMLLGNLVYIPLFSLQKHYITEFGYLIGISLVLLSFFYIRNYYHIGKEQEKTFLQNLSISYSFLIYRFLRNLFLIVLTTIGVTLFVIAILLLLNYNISLLINHNLIERTINL